MPAVVAPENAITFIAMIPLLWWELFVRLLRLAEAARLPLHRRSFPDLLGICLVFLARLAQERLNVSGRLRHVLRVELRDGLLAVGALGALGVSAHLAIFYMYTLIFVQDTSQIDIYLFYDMIQHFLQA